MKVKFATYANFEIVEFPDSMSDADLELEFIAWKIKRSIGGWTKIGTVTEEILNKAEKKQQLGREFYDWVAKK